MKQRIVITGAAGVIGSVLVKAFKNDYKITPLTHSDCDLTKFDQFLTKIPNNTDVIIHLAWDKKPIYENGIFNNDNFLITHNILEASVRKKVRRVILASSVHAGLINPRGSYHLDSPQTSGVYIKSIYGATKLYFEVLARYYATYQNLEVIAIRFGGVNSENSPTAKKEPNYDKIFLAHEDMIKVVKESIEKDLGESQYECVLATSGT